MPPPPEFFREKKQEADWDELFESLSESDSDSSKDGAIGGGQFVKFKRKKQKEGEGEGVDENEAVEPPSCTGFRGL